MCRATDLESSRRQSTIISSGNAALADFTTEAPGETPAPGSTAYRYQYRSYRGRVAEMPHIPTSLLDMYGGKVGFGVPALQVKPLYTQVEMARYGVPQGTEVQVPVFKAMF